MKKIINVIMILIAVGLASFIFSSLFTFASLGWSGLPIMLPCLIPAGIVLILDIAGLLIADKVTWKNSDDRR